MRNTLSSPCQLKLRVGLSLLEFGSDASLYDVCDCLLFQILLFEIGI